MGACAHRRRRGWLLAMGAAAVAAVAAACGGDEPLAAPAAPPRQSDPAPIVEPSPIAPAPRTPATADADAAATWDANAADVVTEDDLLNTTHPLEGLPAPELPTGAHWLGSPPVTLASLRGSVVLIDFWTYSCINCLRTLPFLVEWDAKYGALGLHIIGAHTPEFDFERSAENVRLAISRHALKYPVFLDNDRAAWDAYGVHAWPAKYLIDAEGVVRYAEAGEGGYVALEQSMRHWLAQAGYDVSSVSFEPEDFRLDPELDPAARVGDRELARTREIHAGYERNLPFHRFPPPRPWVLYEQYYEGLDQDVEFEDVQERENQRLYLQGLWHVGPESVRHARATDDLQDYAAIKFNAKTVNAVLGHDGGLAYRARVTLNGAPPPRHAAGEDLRYDDAGEGYALVDEPRMYRLLRMAEYQQGELRLASHSEAFELFTFTFGAYENLEDN